MSVSVMCLYQEKREQKMCSGCAEGEQRGSGIRPWEEYMATTWTFEPWESA